MTLVLLAPLCFLTAPLDDPPSADGALRVLQRQVDAAFQADEPYYGVLPSLVALAFHSAGAESSFKQVQSRLTHDLNVIATAQGQIAALHVLALDPPTDGAAWNRLRSTIQQWLGDLVRTQLFPQQIARVDRRNPRQPPTRRPNPGNPDGLPNPFGTVRSRNRPAVFPPLDSTIALAGLAASIRAVERLGFRTGAADETIPQAWRELEQRFGTLMKRDGSFAARPGGDTDVGSNAAGALVLALARPALIPLGRLDSSFQRDHDEMQKSLSRALERLRKDAGRLPRKTSDWDLLIGAVASARLGWVVGNRAAPDFTTTLTRLQQADGSFDCEGDIPVRKQFDDVAEFYQREEVRPILVNALAVLALTQADRRADRRTDHTWLGRVTPHLERRHSKQQRSLLADLMHSDASATLFALVEQLDSESEKLRDFALDVLTAHTGWDFGYGIAEKADELRHARSRMRDYLEQERQGLGQESATTLGLSLMVLRGNESPAVMDRLLPLLEEGPPQVAKDLERALSSNRFVVRRVAHYLAGKLGAPDVGYDPQLPEAENRKALDALKPWFERKFR